MTNTPFPRHRLLMLSSMLSALAVLGGCAAPGSQPIVPPALAAPQRASVDSDSQGSSREATSLKAQELPQPPGLRPAAEGAPPPAQTPGLDPSAVSAINVEQLSLGTFAQMAFGEVLKKNVSVDAKVLARRDLVTFRTGGAQTAAGIEQAVKLLLKSYGVAVIDTGGLVRVVLDDSVTGVLPEIHRGSALPETPASMRPAFHLIELEATRAGEIGGMLRTMFGDRVRVSEDVARNALLLSSNPDNLVAAVKAIRVLDQPVMAGRSSLALTPAHWSAEDLARRLAEVLGAEGYAVRPLGGNAASFERAPIILVPVSALNSVFVFAVSDALKQHVANWAARLDRPNERGIGRNYFTYQVRHKDAALLAQTLEQVMGGARPSSAPTAGTNASGAQAATARASGVVVDQSSNTLIFQSNPEEYTQVLSLLQTLDKPTKSALIEVTVAELKIDNDSQLGVEWFFNEVLSGGRVGQGGTLGNLGLGTSGFIYRVLPSAASSPRLLLNALAQDNKATILSSPRVMARNGEWSSIQVGDDVPVVTSTQSTNAPSNGNLGTLQTIQYRNTGVILKVKPAIHSGDQVDIDIYQEVSAVAGAGVSNSPVISSRKFDNKLTLTHGKTVMLGGLISDEASGGGSGVPLLKDIPLIGSLFSKQTRKGLRREMIVLITPYVLSSNKEAEELTEAFRSTLGEWSKPIAPTTSGPRLP